MDRATRVLLPRRVAVSVGWSLVALAFTVLVLWCTGAVYFSNLPGTGLRSAAAILFVLGLLVVAVRVRPMRRARRVALAACGVIILWYLAIPASNDRAWQPDMKTVAWATMDGDRMKIHNVRNCEYRTETDYTARYEDRTYELSKLRSVDFLVVYWGSPSIAHTMMSFGFEDGGHVCFSIETRKEIGEDYSAIKGFFRQFELMYVVADERDVVRLRTNFRGEQVYLYRLNTDTDTARQVFLEYLREVNSLKDRPEWYNVVTANCTTMIRGHTKPYARDARFDWRMLINGRIDEMAYERGSLDQSLPFPELKARSLINERALVAGDDPEFSQRIRENLP